MTFPAAEPHGSIEAVFPDVFFVSGSVTIAGPISVRISRNMTVIREGERLVIINSMRLDPSGLAALDALGKVTDVIRVAGFHGMDDPFYKDRYGAKVWAVRGQRYVRGFDRGGSAKTYFSPDVEMDASTALPLSGASLYVLGASPSEGLLVLDREGGVVVAGDCLQNWGATDPFFNLPAKLMMPLMGFIRPHNVGPAWLKNGKPPAADLRGILGLRFDHVLPAHGAAVKGGAKEKYRAAVEKAAAWREK